MRFGKMAPVTVVGLQSVYLTLQKRKQKRVQRRVRIVDMNAIKGEALVILQPTPPVHLQRHIHPICPNLCVRRAIVRFGKMEAIVMVVDIQRVFLLIRRRKQKSVRRRVPVVDITE